MKSTTVALLAVPSLFVSHAEAQRAFEVSEDGRQTVTLQPGASDDGGIAGGGAGHPFGTAPDWFNDLRRPVAGLQIVDMNGDGHNDLVVGCFFSSGCCPAYTDWRNLIYYNTGTALEAQPSWISTDQVHTNDVQVGDINGDGFLDIFSANGGFQHSPSVIYFGSATGPSTSPGWSSVVSPSTWATSAALADFDHDGDLDVVTTNQSGITGDNFRPIYIYYNNGGTLAQTPVALGTEQSIQSDCAFGDYDNDGWEDLAVSKWTNGFQSGIYRNINGVIQPTQIWTRGVSETDKGVTWGDVDGNGWLDLVIGANDPSGAPVTGSRLFSNTAGVLAQTWASQPPFESHSEQAFADLDGDGDLDFAEVHFGDGRAHVYLNDNGVLSTTPSWTYDATTVANALAFGDLNGDKIPDLAVGYSGDISIRVFYGIPPACVADLDGSGSVDVNDLLAVVTNWGACTTPPPNCPGDVDDSGSVDVNDLLAVITTWGDCP